MRNVLILCMMITAGLYLSSCRNPCDGDFWYFYPISSDLRQQSFKPGTYWVYQDSISGTIDSQSVSYYHAETHAEIGRYDRDSEHCIEYGDLFKMRVASYWNGTAHDSSLFYNEGAVILGRGCTIRYVGEKFAHYQYPTDTLTNFQVSGQVFPRVYLLHGDTYRVYSVDNIGVVKWVFDDTINGQHTWDLLRYHVVNP